MRVLFYSGARIGVPFLEEICGHHNVVGVVTQPDKPRGRGLAVEPSPVKLAAMSRTLRIYDPQKPLDVVGELKDLKPDLGVVAAYGRILPKQVLEVPGLGNVNVHFSLLPKYRGAAPVAWCLIRGETETGVTVFWMDEGMDTGPIFVQEKIPIEEADDALTLTGKLVELGIRVLRESLSRIEKGDMSRRPQEGEPAMAPKLKKEDGNLTFEIGAREFLNRVRGLRAWPRARVLVAPREPGGKPVCVHILKGAVEELPASAAPHGTVLKIEKNKGFLVKCAEGGVWIQEVQPEGRKPMPGLDFLNGARLKAGDVIRLT